MTAKEKRAAVVAKAKSREKKNQYTQGSKRTQVGSGWSDCSSFVRWCYLQVLGQDIGGNTAAQIVNKKLTVADNNGKTVPTESNLLPGDLLYFKGTDKSRPLGVGHVELYLGSGKIIGHGSGTGPTIKVMSTYCKSRASSGKGYIKALRVIPDDGDAPAVVPADPLKHPEHGIKITESQVNLRIGPSTGYRHLLTRQELQTLRGQAMAGQYEAASHGLATILMRKEAETGRSIHAKKT